MQKRCVLSVAGILLAFQVAPSLGCTWEGLSPQNASRQLPDQIEYADTIIRGRVISVGNGGFSAQVKVIRLLKGKGDIVALASGGPCGHIFSVGEENIYFVKDSVVSSPSIEPVSNWLVESIANTTKSP